jgi:hypothetical protein
MTKQISPLRQRMIDDMAFRNMSPSRQKVYGYAVANFARFHGQSPDKLGLVALVGSMTAIIKRRRPGAAFREGPNRRPSNRQP